MIAMFPAFKEREKIEIPATCVPHRGHGHEALLFMHSFPFVYQDLAGDRSRSRPQHRRGVALAVKEGQAHFGGDTKVRR
jgi:hypothetical protein